VTGKYTAAATETDELGVDSAAGAEDDAPGDADSEASADDDAPISSEMIHTTDSMDCV
jgi:hypothetical protein